MNPFSADILKQRLARLTGDEAVNRWVVALSGGLDSTVLLHALRQFDTGTPCLAIHVDHAVQTMSSAFADHCRTLCESLGVDFEAVRVEVNDDEGKGLEAAMREARYGALRQRMRPADCLLVAHHEDDQAETLLLHLLRGSGPRGLAGMSEARRFEPGRLLRPLLGIGRAELEAYADEHDLRWIDDPSNADTNFDRNYLRSEILPRLESRWPSAGKRLRQSADLAREASWLLDDLADIDLAGMAGAEGPAVLKLDRLVVLPGERQRNVLRRALRLLDLPPAPANRLHEIVERLLPAREDATPVVCWPGVEVRRYRDCLFLLPAMSVPEADAERLLLPGAPVELGHGLGVLSLVENDGPGIDPDLVGDGLILRFRHGGESIRISTSGATRTLKNLLQEKGVLPWMRERIPLLFADADLVAVADLWQSATHQKTPGLGIRWQGRPSLTRFSGHSGDAG